jgi:hypothetical protein
MAFDNLNLDNLSDEQLTALHERTSGAVRDRRPIQVEDIRAGMKPEDMDRAQKEITKVLAGLK